MPPYAVAPAVRPSRAPVAPPPRSRPPTPPPRALLHPSRRTAALIPAALMLGLGLWGIGRGGAMWRDESSTYQAAHRDIADLWHMLGNADAVHGLYYLLMHAWFAVWDGGVVALRLPSALAMAAAAAAVALLAYRLAGPRSGLAAGLVFALTPEVQRYAQEGRSYALVCALVAWSCHLLLCAVARGGTGTWVAYSGTVLVACLLHEFAAPVLLAHGVTLLWARVPRPVVRAWGRAAGGAVLGLLPLALFSRRQSGQVEWISGPGWRPMVVFAVLVLVGAVCAAAPDPARFRVPLRTLALPLLIVPTVALLLLSLYQPLYLARYALYSYVGLSVLAGAGLDRAARAAVRRGRLPTLGAAGTALAVLVTLVPVMHHLHTPASRKDDTTAAARAVRDLAAPGDGVLFAPGRRREPLMSYPQDFRGLTDLALSRDAVSAGTLHGVELPAQRVRARMLDAQRIVVVGDPPDEPQDATAVESTKRSVLEEFFEPCASRRVHGLVVTLYARPGSCR